MPLQIVRNDIVKMKADAIVNLTDSSYSASGGVDRLIHEAAGPGLMAECRQLGPCPVGGAVVTGGYDLACSHVIHTVGPRWIDGQHQEEKLLSSCYRSVLEAARERQCKSIAIPLIASGSFGYPKPEALKCAVDTIGSFLLESDMTVYLVVFDNDSFAISSRLFADIASFIDEKYVSEHVVSGRSMRYACLKDCSVSYSLDNALSRLDEGFSDMLLRKIKEKGMSEVECYKKANIDRKLFSKIRSDRLYRPSKQTVLAFGIALELPLGELSELLLTAGYALSHSSKADIIVEYFVREGNYSIHEINEALFAFDQSLIGSIRD